MYLFSFPQDHFVFYCTTGILKMVEGGDGGYFLRCAGIFWRVFSSLNLPQHVE
jgi:hypothetical protein